MPDRKLVDRGTAEVAIVRALRGLGDLLCMVPALRALRRNLPDARLTLIGLQSAKWVRERYPDYVDEIVEFPGYPGIPEARFDPAELRRFMARVEGRFDLALQMHGSGTNSNAFALLLGARRTAGFYLPALWCPDPELFLPYSGHLHEVHQLLELVEFLGMETDGDRLEFPVREEDRVRLAELVGSDDEPLTCLHPGAEEEARRWPAANFAAVGDHFTRRGHRVVLTGTEAERDLATRVASAMEAEPKNLAGATDLGMLAALFERSRLLVCNDTGVSHLAAATRTPSVVVFSASDPDRWAPLDRRLHRVVGEPVPERRNACLHTPYVRGHRCLRDACSSLLVPEEPWRPASADEVVAQAEDLLAGIANTAPGPNGAGGASR